MPNGMTFSGYACKNLNDKSYHLILFREASNNDTYTFNLPENINGKTVEIIYQNADANITVNGATVTAKFSKQRSFVWVKVK